MCCIIYYLQPVFMFVNNDYNLKKEKKNQNQNPNI